MRSLIPLSKAEVVVLALCGSLLAGCGGSPRLTGPALPSHPSLQRSADATEVSYYNGLVYRWQFPSGGSSDQNELVLPDCFRAGPDFTQHTQFGQVARLYALFLPGATQHSCPDGSDLHDHVLSDVPGTPGYATLWDLIEAWPGPNFNPAIMPITSEDALLNAARLGQVIIIDDQIVLHAAVIGPAN